MGIGPSLQTATMPVTMRPHSLLRSVAGRIVDEEWAFRKEPASPVFRQAPSRSGLPTDLVVDRLVQPLLAPEVPFRCFHRDAAQEKLNLFKFSAGRVT